MSFDRMVFFLKNGRFRFHLTDCSYSIRIVVHVPNFFVAARRRERKKMFLYCHYYYSNRVEKMIKVTDCNELENLAEFYIFIWGTAPVVRWGEMTKLWSWACRKRVC
jgi:hypothetical protein